MSQDFQKGDFLVFQIEAGYGLLRILEIEGSGDERIWHLRAFDDMFLDVDQVEAALSYPDRLGVRLPHVAITTRAFEATQVARIKHLPLDPDSEKELAGARASGVDVNDRSIRLMLGLR